jgi:hypothetical protein
MYGNQLMVSAESSSMVASKEGALRIELSDVKTQLKRLQEDRDQLYIELSHLKKGDQGAFNCMDREKELRKGRQLEDLQAKIQQLERITTEAKTKLTSLHEAKIHECTVETTAQLHRIRLLEAQIEAIGATPLTRSPGMMDSVEGFMDINQQRQLIDQQTKEISSMYANFWVEMHELEMKQAKSFREVAETVMMKCGLPPSEIASLKDSLKKKQSGKDSSIPHFKQIGVEEPEGYLPCEPKEEVIRKEVERKLKGEENLEAVEDPKIAEAAPKDSEVKSKATKSQTSPAKPDVADQPLSQNQSLRPQISKREPNSTAIIHKNSNNLKTHSHATESSVVSSQTEIHSRPIDQERYTLPTDSKLKRNPVSNTPIVTDDSASQLKEYKVAQTKPFAAPSTLISPQKLRDSNEEPPISLQPSLVQEQVVERNQTTRITNGSQSSSTLNTTNSSLTTLNNSNVNISPKTIAPPPDSNNFSKWNSAPSMPTTLPVSTAAATKTTASEPHKDSGVIVLDDELMGLLEFL